MHVCMPQVSTLAKWTCLMKRLWGKYSTALTDWSIVSVWLKQPWSLLFQSQPGSAVSMGGIRSVQPSYESYKSEARMEKVAGQDLNHALVWCHSPAWWQRCQLHKPQRTLSDCSEIISLVQKSSAFTSSNRATEGFFYQTVHQRNKILDRRLQQATVGLRVRVTDTSVAANVEAAPSS